MPTTEPYLSFFETWRRGGWVGVDLFFVLSGFLVSGLLFAEYRRNRSVSLGRFFVRRAWKIYPPFFVLIAFTVIYDHFAGVAYRWRNLAAEVFFLQSYFNGLWWHTWSLSVEEHFYLLLPLATALSLRHKSALDDPFRPLAYGLAFLALLCLILRLGTAFAFPYSHYTNLFPSHLRMDSLGFGVAISYFYHFHHLKFVKLFRPFRVIMLALGAALLVPAFLLTLETSPFIYTVGLSVFYVGSGFLVVGMLLSQIPGGWLRDGIATLGRYSYSIYLWHLPVSLIAIPFIAKQLGLTFSFPAWFAMYVIGSLATGSIMARVVEIPALHLRDLMVPRNAPRPVGEIAS
jgi:peptidoglycan/LPS O-acetylase OafA/YrhL